MSQYNHKKIEKKWQDYWEEHKLFNLSENVSENIRYILDMFPYPSADGLHVGHPEGYTATDIVSRYLRMNKKNVLHTMGWDAFGLPAENYAVKQGIHPKESTESNINNFRSQIKSLGLSYDWTREINTSDPSYYKWTQWMFLKLYEKGLVYRKKAPVNWCESCQTVLAREQVIDGKCERCKYWVIQKNLVQWFFKVTQYADRLLNDLEKLDWPESIKLMQKNWIGRSEGTTISFMVPHFQEILLATNNSSKVSRVKKLLENTGIRTKILTPHDLNITGKKIKEEGNLLENAQEKALAYKGKTKMPILAADSGFFVDGKEIDPIRVKRNALDGKNESSLTQDQIAEMILNYYKNFASKHGGNVEAYWLDVWALVMPNGKIKTATSKREVILTNQVKGEVDIYFPMRSLYKVKATGKYPAVQSNEEELEELSPITNVLRELLSEQLSVFTTRPDTLFGATYMVVAPEHPLIHNLEFRISNFERVKEYIETSKKKSELERTDLAKEKTGVELQGIKAINPANGEEIPTWVADYVMINYGTGAIMAVPAHDQRDYEFAKKFSLPIKEVIRGGDISKEAYSGDGTLINSNFINGLSVPDAIKKTNDWLEENKYGKRAVTYKLRDWLVSRQRYWGTPIPIIYCDKCGEIPVPESDLPVKLPDDVDFMPTGESPLAQSNSFHNISCPKCGALSEGVKRESDTMDTFVDSSWYFLRYTDPHNDKIFASKKNIHKFCPVDLYVGGAEHAVLHLMYARFFTKALKDMEYLEFDEPFSKLKNQGMVLGEDGQKMSKSRGNVINPDEIVEKFGADSMRLYEMFMGPLEDTKAWSTDGLIGMRRFLEKIWVMITERLNELYDPGLADEDKINHILHKTIKKVTEDIESMKFNTAISQLMIFFNEKNNLRFETKKEVEIFSTFLKLLSPFAPHICEELWQILGHNESIAFQPWPEFDEKLTKENEIELVLQVNGKVRDKLMVPADISEEDAKEIVLASEKIQSYLKGDKPRKVIYVSGKLVNIVI